jgi:aarF domain-containing kinase
MKKTAPPKSIFERSSKLLGLAAGIAGRELANRAVQAFQQADEVARKIQQVKTQVQQAKEIVSALGQLKGAAMKVGQLLTVELRDYLAPEVIEVLKELQNKAQPVDWATMEQVLREEFGAEKMGELIDLQKTALASASIGQVHRAAIRDGNGERREIVLKIQYPGISDTIESDCALMAKVANALLAVSFKDVDFSGTVEEVKEVLVLETDYLREAQNLKRAAELVGSLSGVSVPRVIERFTTRRVLAMDFEEGLTLEQWMATQPSAEDRSHFAQLFLDLYFREFFEWGFVQTDPNFGNFLIRPDRRELVLLDYGAAKEYSKSFRKQYGELTLANDRKDREETLRRCFEIGFFDSRESDEAQEAFYRVLQTVHRIFEKERQPCRFQDSAYVDPERNGHA